VTKLEPSRFLLEKLSAEHQNGTWVGLELLPVAGEILALGGDEDDYERWVLSSNLWHSYTCSTGDSVVAQERSRAGAWFRAVRSPNNWNLEDELTGLATRISAYNKWPNARTAHRDRAVALAFVKFCSDHNCYTRTLSSYELAKHTAGISQRSVHRALMALLDLGLLREVQRADKRTSARSTRRYRVFLRWGVTTRDSRNTCKSSLSQELQPPHDVWAKGSAYKGGPTGLGLGAQRVWEVLTDEPTTVRQVSEVTGMKTGSVRRYLKILADNCLAGVKPGAPGEPTLYFRVDTPLDAVAEMRGISGVVETRHNAISGRQHNNRLAYPGTYWRPSA